MAPPGGRPVPAIRRRRPRRRFTLSVSTIALITLGLAAGCTFERRPQTQVNADPGQIRPPVPEEPASSFFEGLQAARLSGSEEELRAMLHPEATVMLDDRILSLDRDAEEPDDGGPNGDRDVDQGAASGWSVLARRARTGRTGGASVTVTDSAVFEGAAFFVVDYDADVETLVLARDSAGWSLRLLHRVTGDGGPR